MRKAESPRPLAAPPPLWYVCRMNTKRLVILAAGMGSRYGGLKQMDPIGPHGEFLLDYSIRDALAAGFQEVVFVIRHDLEEDFRRIVGDRWEARGVPVHYAFQELTDLPDGFAPPEGRTKPWGTGHALLAARRWLDVPFAVVNADDYYDAPAFRAIADYLDHSDGSDDYVMVGYGVAGTLSSGGSVSRGVCKTDADGYLTHIEERLEIMRCPDGVIRDGDLALPDDIPVSMNLFGFRPSYAAALQAAFVDFLRARGTELKSEFYITLPLQSLIDAGRVRLKVLRSDARWFGVTNRSDRPGVQAALAQIAPVWDAEGSVAPPPKPAAGFTLLEVIIAMTIVAILGTVVGLQLHDLPQKGRVNAARTQLATFKTALEIYAADNGAPPTQQQGLGALVAPPTTPPVPTKWNPNGYLDSRAIPADPWGRSYAYFSPGSDGLPYEIVCYGADGEEGGEGFNADLSSADPL